MKRILALLLGLMVVGCASGTKAKLIQPEVELVQITGPADTLYQGGNIEVQYGLRVANRSAEPITLQRVLIETIGSGGPYRVPRDYYYIRHVVEPGKFGDVTFWVRAESTGSRFSIDAQAPITVRGTAYFSSPLGSLRKVFVTSLGQTERDRVR
jgi:hypothetical protein